MKKKPKLDFYEIKASSNSVLSVYIYGYVGNSMWDEVNPKSLIDEIKEFNGLSEINVHINSGGGSVYGGNAIYNLLKMHEATVNIYIEGLAASMASVIAMAGDNVYMADNSLMMIHNPWSWAEGDAEQFRKAADQLDKAKTTLISSYKKKTDLDEDVISEYMENETWFTASEALELGFIDQITDEIDLAASIKGVELGEFKNAPKKLVNLMSESTGATKEEVKMVEKTKVRASVENTGVKVEPKVAQAPENSVNVNLDIEAKAKKAAEDALKAEGIRRSEVENTFKPFGDQYAELERECLNDFSVSPAEASKKLLAEIGKNPVSPVGVNVKVLEDERDKIRNGFAASMLAKAGIIRDQETNEFRGYSLNEMARHSLEKAGVNTRSMDKLEMVGAAFTHSTSDFPNILKDVMHKTMLKGWEESPETFQEWTSRGILTDFRESSRVGLNSFPNLDVIGEGAEYKSGTIGDRGEVIQLATYGKMMSLSRQSIINDDLSAFTKIPVAAGRAARRTIGNLVYAVLTGNPLMSDGVALFASGHSNIGTGGIPTTASIDEMRKLMALQKESATSDATALGITPFAILCPEALRGKMIALIESETEMASSQNNSKRPNYVRNIAKVISDARLDADSAVKYYMVASPAMFDTIEVSYLDGVEQPFLEQKDGWTVDGVQMKVRIDAGVKALDYRTMAYNAGA